MSLAQRAAREKADLALLTSPQAGEMLRLALNNRARVLSWRVHQRHHRPGAGVSVGYSVILSDHSDLYMLASTARVDEAALAASGGLTLTFDDTRVHLWEYPFDPELPALELASDSVQLGAFLGADVNIELLSYRPTRRAVLRIEPEHGEDLYAKVVRPSTQHDLMQRIRTIESSTIPSFSLLRDADGEVLSARGLILTHAASGVPLSRFYSQFTPNQLPEARSMLGAIERTLDSIPRTAMLFPRKPAWVDKCEHYAHAAAVAYPRGAEAAADVARIIRSLLSQAELGQMLPTHGDFYEANVLVNPDELVVTGLLDLDSLGPGRRVHDWGCLLGHLSVLPSLAPTRYPHAETLCSYWFDVLSSKVDPVALCASTAGVILSLVAGAHKRSESLADIRLTLAQEWAAAGEQILASSPAVRVIPLT